MILAGLFQAAGIASIAPFITVSMRPELIDTNNTLRFLAETLGLTSTNSFLVFLGGAFISIILFGNLLLALTSWLTNRFIARSTHDLSARMLASYLCRDYTFHLRWNSAQILKNSLNEVHRAMFGGVFNFMIIIARGISVIFITLLLSFVDFYISLAVIVTLGGAYCIIYLLVRKTLMARGQAITELEGGRFRSAQEALGGIKEVKIFGLEDYYLNQFDHISRDFHSQNAVSRTISEVPRYLLEVVAFGGALTIALIFIIKEGNASEALPLIAVYAFAGYRLLPALQRIYGALSVQDLMSAQLISSMKIS